MKIVSYCSAAMLALTLSGTALAGHDHRRHDGYRAERGHSHQYRHHQPQRQHPHWHSSRDHRAPQVVIHRHYHQAPPPRPRYYYGQRLPRGYGVPIAAHHAHRLPRHHGHEWRQAGPDLILISISTGVIRDILYGYRY